MAFEFQVPSPTGPITVSIEPGTSVIFVGANGGGKTRLAVRIEETLNLNAHRVSAHRALTLNPTVAKISEQQALMGLRTGFGNLEAQVAHRTGHRWHGKMAVSLLNDFDFLVQALFADQANKALNTHKKVRAGDHETAELTKFERLEEIWGRLLPHRVLQISGDDIQVSIPESGTRYPAAEMSDGERAIFYLIGQALAAPENTLLIFDEPELHVHRSIMAKLWDELEAARQDCAFVFITHDLEFAATRIAQKFCIRDYDPVTGWTLESVPEDTGFDEETATLILGSRHPILFVEGDENSLDTSIYRSAYPDWTVISKGSCEEVVHSVVTMRRNAALTRITCSGIVDADGRETAEINYLNELGVAALSVSEIENVLLLPEVSRAIAETDGYTAPEIEEKLINLKVDIFATINSPGAIEKVAIRQCKRAVDRLLKRVDLSDADSVVGISIEYRRLVGLIDIEELSRQTVSKINEIIRTDNLVELLAVYDNKGLLALAARHLKRSKRCDFEAWIARVLRNEKEPSLARKIREYLPNMIPR